MTIGSARRPRRGLNRTGRACQQGKRRRRRRRERPQKLTATRGTKLVIVESPSKARTIAGYLGQGYVVESSVGHIRDMPDRAAEIPAKYRAEPWARLGVNVDDNFEPLYVVHSDKKQQVAKLKSLLKDADELLLATDEDREGEAIAWHLLEELKPKVPHSRMVFHEITPEAIARAIANPRQVNEGLVDAYQARRVLDRLYGYEVSPVLWKKVMPKLSAGRVQSVATRLIVDRERERIAFRAASYSDLEAEFATKDHGQKDAEEPTSFTANLVTVDGRRVAQGRDFTAAGELRSTGRPAPGRRGRGRPGPAPGERDLLGRQRRAQALPPLAVRAVPHHHAAAGGLAQAGLLGQAHHVGGAAAVRERLHHLYAHRLGDAVPDRDQRGPQAGQRALRSHLRPGRPAHLRQQGQERPGGARGHPPGRGQLPHPGPGRPGPPVLRRTPAVRADLAAHRRLADEGRHRRVGVGPGGGHVHRGRARRVRRQRQGHQLLRLPQGLRGGRRRPRPPTATTGSAGCRRWPRPTRSTCCGWPRPSTPPGRRPATPRPRWSRSWKTGRSAGRRPTRRSSARSWTAATCSRRAPRWSPRSWPSPWSRCSSGTSASWSTTSSPPGWKTPWTASPAARPSGCPGCAGSTSAPTATPEMNRASSTWSATSATSTPGT